MIPNITEQNRGHIATEIEQLVHKYDSWATDTQYLTVILASLAIGLPLVISSFSNLPNSTIRILAFVAALSATLLTTLRIDKKAQDFRNAYRYLQYAKYKYDAGISGLGDLIEAFYKAESQVGQVEIDSTKIPDMDQPSEQEAAASKS